MSVKSESVDDRNTSDILKDLAIEMLQKGKKPSGPKLSAKIQQAPYFRSPSTGTVNNVLKEIWEDLGEIIKAQSERPVGIPDEVYAIAKVAYGKALDTLDHRYKHIQKEADSRVEEAELKVQEANTLVSNLKNELVESREKQKKLQSDNEGLLTIIAARDRDLGVEEKRREDAENAIGKANRIAQEAKDEVTAIKKETEAELKREAERWQSIQSNLLNQVDEHRTRTKNLESQLDEKTKEYKKEIGEKTTQILEQSSAIKVLEEKLSVATQKISENKELLTTLTASEKELNKQISTLQTSLDAATTRYTEIVSKYDALEQTNKELMQQVSSCQAESTSLREQVDYLKKLLEEHSNKQNKSQ